MNEHTYVPSSFLGSEPSDYPEDTPLIPISGDCALEHEISDIDLRFLETVWKQMLSPTNVTDSSDVARYLYVIIMTHGYSNEANHELADLQLFLHGQGVYK